LDIQDPIQANRGRGYWKFNSQLLLNDQFTKALKSKIQEWKVECTHLDSRQAWEWMKYNIRLFSMDFSKRTAKNKKDKIDTLIQELKKLDKEITDNQNIKITDNQNIKITDNQNIKFKEKQMELENLMKEKTEGIILRSKVQWYEV
jgi:hypothetical protein